MNLGKIFIAVWLLFILQGSLIAQGNSQDKPTFFIQITDIQFGMYSENEGFEEETMLYEKAVDEINKLGPDFVVNTGDFVHNPNSVEQIAEFKRISALINKEIPVYLIPGNHDFGHTPDIQSIAKYTENYGDDRFSFEYNGSSYIGFNSNFIKAIMPEQEKLQYDWLKKELEKSKDSKHIVLFCHHPFILKEYEEPEVDANIGLEMRKKYLALFEDNGVAAVFAGHYHQNVLASYKGIKFVTTSNAGKFNGYTPSGMRLIKVFNDTIEHNFYGFDEIPETYYPDTFKISDDSVLTKSSSIYESSSIYPNPAVSKLYINNPSSADFSYKIFSISGQLVSKRDKIRKTKTEVDVSKFAKGIYFVVVESGDIKGSYKLFVE